MITCANCQYNDGMCYTSNPPKYKCTKDYGNHDWHSGDFTCYYMKKAQLEVKNTKEYNCPDCKVAGDTCVGCQRYMDRPTNTVEKSETDLLGKWLKEWAEPSPVPYDIKYPLYNDYDNNDPCRNCSNDPRNGGSGICNCTIPYMHQWRTGTPTKTYITTTTDYTLKDIYGTNDTITSGNIV